MADAGASSRIAALVGVAVAAVAAYFLLRPTPRPAATTPPAGSEIPQVPASALETAGPVATAVADAGAAAAPQMPELDRARADAIRARLKALYGVTDQAGKRADPRAGGEFPVMAQNDPSPDALKNYIHDRIHDDYFPLAKSCYENALVKSPKLAGKLVMSFKIVGDRRVGGVVDSADVDPETTMKDDDEFVTCMKESMMAVSFDAPPDDKPITVKYPISFSPGDAD